MLSIDLKFDKKIFEPLSPKVTKLALKTMIKDICSGTSNNPLYKHWQDGQSQWQEDSPDYAKTKEKKMGTNNKFQWSGDALKAIKARQHKYKKYKVSYRKKKDYFLATATIVKKNEGYNVYKIAQAGKFGGIEGTSKGKKIKVGAKDWLKDFAKAGKMYKGSDAEKSGVKKGTFKQALMQEKYKFDKGSTKRIGRNERWITMNLQGDDNIISRTTIKKYVDIIMKKNDFKR